MPQFLAQTSRGLVEVLEQELAEMGFSSLKKVGGGVLFESNWEGCYRANLCLRTATRVVLPVLDFPAYQNDELYHNVKKHDFTKYIEPAQTLAIDASVLNSSFRDQRFVALKVKDAIVDQFREKFGVRPDVDAANPDLRVSVRCVRNQFSLAIDTTGEPLFKRGYRSEQMVTAPMKEHLAAGLLKLAQWTPDIPLVDPMCGGGTILIEAAMIARQMAPGSHRRHFIFQKLKGYQKDIWRKVAEEVGELEQSPFTSDEQDGDEPGVDDKQLKIYGFDWDKKSIRIARQQANDADVGDMIQFQAQGLGIITNPFVGTPHERKGMIIVNPPYGHRLGTRHELEDTYKDLGFMMKQNFSGWQLWIISTEAELTSFLKMKSTRKFQVFNGPLECRFLKYEIK